MTNALHIQLPETPCAIRIEESADNEKFSLFVDIYIGADNRLVIRTDKTERFIRANPISIIGIEPRIPVIDGALTPEVRP